MLTFPKSRNQYDMVNKSVPRLSHFVYDLWSLCDHFVLIIKVKIFMLIKWSYRSPPQIILTKEPRMVVIFKHSY